MRTKGLDKYPIELVCQTLGICRSAYYSRKETPQTDKELDDRKLRLEARKLFEENHEEYGRATRMRKALKENGYRMSEGKVRRIMQAEGLVPKKSRKYKATTNSKHNYQVAENILNRELKMQRSQIKSGAETAHISIRMKAGYMQQESSICAQRIVWGYHSVKDIHRIS